MTIIHEAAVTTWSGPDSVALRGTLVVLPGRGETPAVYERFGRRLAADSYRVHAVTAPSLDPARAADVVAALVAESEPDVPRVVVGSDAGALYAVQLAARSQIDGASALILAGLPSAEAAGAAGDWDAELEARTACTTHRARISTGGVQPGELYDGIPAQWFDAAPPQRLQVPVLGLHGADDVVSPLAEVRSWYAKVPRAELVSIAGGRHDALNDQTHRSVAATIVLFLERVRLGGDLTPITVVERLYPTGSTRRG
jgi:alpha-beta hydrolase superfamily lysophospholipase